ncbi:MAG: BON domain-containing protein [Planctomycetota bacterium]
MRRFLFGVVIASVAAAMPSWAFAGDREIAKAVMSELQQHKAAGQLKGFDLDMQVEDGVVYLNGRVASRDQRSLVAKAAADAVGVGNLVNNIKVVPVKATPKPLPKTTVVKTASQTTSRKKQPVAKAPAKQQIVRTAAAQKPRISDTQVTDSVIGRLASLKKSGDLKGFELDVSTENGDLWLKGRVANKAQKILVLETARRVRGVARVVDDIKVVATQVRPASTGITHPQPVPNVATMPSSQPLPPSSSMPTVQPQPYVQATPVPMGGAPVPMNTVAYGGGAPRYDQPNMPNYAWPSYAAQNNYAAVTYPKQYSPSAWPYIGPFYPYPQVPLGWRKVALEWDDGLWYLDFTSK